MDPVASIVIPVYNQVPQFLAAAIGSALAQTLPVEVIVVDDGSDPSAAVPDGVRVIRHDRNRGIAAALNTGLAAMATDWFCWLSSDDEIAPTKVQAQLGHLMRVGGFASHHAYWTFARDEAPGPIYSARGLQVRPQRVSQTCAWESRGDQNWYLRRDCRVNGSTAAIHRTVFERVGEFDSQYRYGQDYEMWLRIGQEYDWHAVPCPACKRVPNITRPEHFPPRTSDCSACVGFGVAVLGARRQGGNLTEAIDADPELRAFRDSEDTRIRKAYRR